MKKNPVFILLVIAILLGGCLPSQTPTEPVIPFGTPLSTPTPPPPEPVTLTVCMGEEPNTLYPFGELNGAARTVLAAIYDGPVDMIAYDYQPVILTTLPSLENEDAQIFGTEVQSGSPVVDADGNLVSLGLGTRVKPAGCRSEDCVITYDGGAPLEMDQMVVTFRLRTDLTWSDGVPLTAEDSVYSFDLHSETSPEDYLIRRTEIYEAADEQTLQWWGIPGFVDATYFMNFWMPAPKHAWSGFPAGELPQADFASLTPTGWGPYLIQEWRPGDQIILEKNPYYFRSKDGYPRIETLTFRFISDPNLAIGELVAGRCDILDPTIHLDQHVDFLLGMQSAGQAQVYVTTGMSIEWLGLGLVPASYDDGYDIQKDRQNIFADPHTRRGIAHCLDRQSLVDNVLFGLTTVPKTYVPAEHPVFDGNIAEIPFDPQAGLSLLQLAGWQDSDNDPSTPLRAVNVKNVAFNTPLRLTYYTTPSTQRRQGVEILRTSLAECGIALDVEYLSPNDLYAAGPVGPLFGRNFDLAQYALGIEGFEPPCAWFVGERIPSEANAWSGTNVTGFNSAEYDAACREAQASLRDETAYLTAYRRTQVILADELPAIPLYYRLRIAAARPEICRFDLDPTANTLWNIEAIGVDETCQN